jgi:GT2 family glycosyltransferase
MEPKIGLVTVLYNSDGVLDGFFKSISEQEYNYYTLYIVDNSVNTTSTELIFKLLRAYNLEENTVYLPSDDNYGVAKGNNCGINRALEDGCEYVILLNNDIEFYERNIFSELVRESVEKNKLMVSPKIHYYNTNRIWYVGCTFNKYRVYANHIGYKEVDSGQYNIAREFDSGPTCFIMFHKNVFSKVGLMDEKYFVYMDDIDFLYRCNKKGFKNYYYPNLLIQHKENYSTGGNNSPFSFFYILRNRIYFVRNNYSGVLKIMTLIYLLFAFGIKSIIQNRLNLYFKAVKEGFNL